MEDESRWLRTSLSQECAGPAYESLSWVAGLALVQVFVPPLVILIALWRSNFKHMKYFTVNYTPQAWFFELYRLYRKAVFVFIAVMMTKSTEQCFTATALMMFSLAFTAHVQPWVVGWINLLDCIGHMVIILCILIGITWCSDTDQDPATATGASVAVVSMVTLYAAALALVLLYQTCGKVSAPLPMRKRFSSMFSMLNRRQSSNHGEINTGETELPASDSGQRNPFKHMKEISTRQEMNRVSFSSDLPMDMAPECPDSDSGIEMQDVGIGSQPALARSKTIIDLR
jgi:hypothetical protein